MSRGFRRGLPALLVAMLGVLALAGTARAQEELAPERANDTLGRLQLRCKLIALCPYSADVWGTFLAAMAGKPGDQYLLGIYLMTGDKVRRDERGGLHWIGVAAAQGYARAGLELNRQRRNGAEMDVDETRIAAAMRTKADAGDADAMRALSEMYIFGRGVGRDPDEALRLLHRAAESGSAEAEQDLANLLLRGAPGVAQNPKEASRWLASSGGHGNTTAMLVLSNLLTSPPPGIDRQPAEAYRWLMRAALLDDPDAQEELSSLFANGMDSEGHAVTAAHEELKPHTQEIARLATTPGMPQQMRDRINRMLQPQPAPATLVAPDLVQADKWFRLAARNP